MKNQCFLLFCILIISCVEKDNSGDVMDIGSFPQQWALTGMSGGLTGSFFQVVKCHGKRPLLYKVI